MSSALTKVPTGAWFTIMLAAVLSIIFTLWRFGKEQQWTAEKQDRFQTSHLLATSTSGEVSLTPAFGGGVLTKVNGMGIFFDKVGDMVPIVLTQFVSKFKARPEVMVFFHMRPLSTPSIPEAERYVIQRTSIPGCYRMTVRHGYADLILSPDLARLVTEQLVLFVTRGTASSTSSVSSVDHSPGVQAELELIKKASEAQTVFIMGKEQLKIKKGTNFFRTVLLWAFLWMRENSRTNMADMSLDHDNLVEVGFVKEI